MEFTGPIKKAKKTHKKKKKKRKKRKNNFDADTMKTNLMEKDKSDLISISLKGTKFYPPQNSCEQ